MSQDFALVLTPAIARRLLRLPSHAHLDLPPEVAEIAEQDRIAQKEFDSFICPPTPERVTISQFLLDCDCRAILQARFHPCMDEISVLNVARLTHSPVSVITNRKAVWRDVAKTLFMTNVSFVSFNEADGEWIDNHCGDVLICDLQFHGLLSRVSRFGREFARILVYQTYTVLDDNFPHWSILAQTLFPTMPHPSLSYLCHDSVHPLKDWAPYYNYALFPEFISSDRLEQVDTIQMLGYNVISL